MATKQKESLAEWVIRTTPRATQAPVVKKTGNSPRLVPIKVWASMVFGDYAPCANTLRRWISNGRISPAPKKVGKNWFVNPNAKYISD